MADGFVPPAEVRSNAKRGLELRQKYNRGGTMVGVARARDLSNGKALSLDTINRMISYFARHEVDKKGEGWGVDSAGYMAWLLWGGDAGKAWANSIAKEQKKDKSMANDMASAYAEIIKAEKQDDGTMLVYGKATDDTLDIDQQICDPSWLSTAMPQWFKTGGNIREQHSSIAAGVAKEYEEKDDGHYIQALVVDPNSVKKVEHGVLKGFSIGIKSPRIVRDQKAANGRIIDGQIVEVSLVDRPANPNAKLIMAKSVEGEADLVQVEELVEKRTFSADERADAADAGQAMPDGSYPIKNVEDLKNAIQAYGRAKDPAAVKRHIIRRARALNAVNQLPEGWNVDKQAVVDVIMELHKSAKGDAVKFDQQAYDTARQALANLIIVEAGEMADGSDERDDIEELLDALKHLFNWYEGEADEGETGINLMDLDAAKGAKAMTSKDCECDGCKACKDAGSCDNDPCDKCMTVNADKEKSAEVSKCLECGCHQPANNHGATQVTDVTGNLETNTAVANVSTATTINTDGFIKSVEADNKDFLDDKVVTSIVEKAVKSATESVKSEIDNLKAVLQAAEQKSVELENELAIAKSVVIPGGPARTANKVSADKTNNLIAKAAEYRRKAEQTTDKDLIKGYKVLEKEYLAKAGKLDEADLDKE
jgi:hypothetical protein